MSLFAQMHPFAQSSIYGCLQVVEVPDRCVCMQENCCIAEQLEGEAIANLTRSIWSQLLALLFPNCLPQAPQKKVADKWRKKTSEVEDHTGHHLTWPAQPARQMHMILIIIQASDYMSDHTTCTQRRAWPRPQPWTPCKRCRA